jgi:lipid-binding SYLF domain-containing protein
MASADRMIAEAGCTALVDAIMQSFTRNSLRSTQVKLIRIATVMSVVLLSLAIVPAFAEDAFEADANAALSKLYESEPAAKMIGEKAKAVLVFPRIVKAGFIVGGQYGEGVLLVHGKLVAHYNSVAGSYGLQAGVQAFGYALFLMTDNALQYLDKSDGWEIGVGPSIVIVDKGIAKTLTTTTLKDDVYAFIFDQKGLMAGLGLQGSKITKLEK